MQLGVVMYCGDNKVTTQVMVAAWICFFQQPPLHLSTLPIPSLSSPPSPPPPSYLEAPRTLLGGSEGDEHVWLDALAATITQLDIPACKVSVERQV